MYFLFMSMRLSTERFSHSVQERDLQNASCADEYDRVKIEVFKVDIVSA